MTEYWMLDDVLCFNPSNEKIKQSKDKIQIVKNDTDDVVIQTWNLNDNKIIDYSWSITEMDSLIPSNTNFYNPKYYFRNKFFEESGINYTPQSLRRVSIPKKYFVIHNGKKAIKGLGNWIY